MLCNKKTKLGLCVLASLLILTGSKGVAKEVSTEVIKTETSTEYREFDIPRYTFEGNITKDAHVIEYKDFKIIQPLYLQHDKQQLTYKQIANEFKKVPQVLTNNIKEIELLDYRNVNDEHWEKVYKIKGIRTYASSLNNRICFYANDHFSNSKNINITLSVLIHESAHILDETISSQTNRLSNSKEWTDAMENDLILKDVSEFGLYCSEYSQSASSNVEDFAEAVVQYVLDKDKFTKEYPNRSKKIEQIFNNSIH